MELISTEQLDTSTKLILSYSN